MNVVAQAAAAAALDDDSHVRRSVELNRAEKARLAAALRARGYRVLPSLTNFVAFDTRRSGRDVFKKLLAHGVIVRPLDPTGLPSFLRVSVGTQAENDAFLAALDAVEHGPGA
jgi:histidinol-phosphate aminotransferase